MREHTASQKYFGVDPQLLVELEQKVRRGGALMLTAPIAHDLPAALPSDSAVADRLQRPIYRPDVDGLRAVAVVAVLVFHYWHQRFPGGYVGVDIFFVISGYLLSAIIVSDVQRGRFTFSHFYERRIRRIFPALFVVLAACTAGAWLLLWPSDLLSFSRSMLAATLSSSNFYFSATSNYFSGNGGNEPLLHTWSLAVEEQFYVVFPILIVLVHRYFRRRLRTVIALLTLSSLVWSIIGVRINPSAAFYLPFTRAWELLFGAMLTLRMIPVPRARVSREALAAFGVVGIAIAIFGFSELTTFPGENSILPCAAAGAIILAGQDERTWASRMLSWRPVVFIGLISYSLYLWHWPLLVFVTNLVVLPKHIPKLHAILAGASVLLATLSWRFVETPFRKGPRMPSKRTVFMLGAGCVGAFTAAALLLMVSGGAPGRFPATAESIASYLPYADMFPAEFKRLFRPGCFLGLREPVSKFDEGRCLGPASGKSQVLIFGDSQASDLHYGLESAFPDVQFLQATSAACHPLLGEGRTPECREFVSKVLEEYIPGRSISQVVLNAEWTLEDLPSLTKTIEALRRRGVGVIVFGPRPEYQGALPRLLAASVVRGDATMPHRYLLAKSAPIDAAMDRLAKETWHVPYISLMALLCPKDECAEYAAPGVPLQFDYDHLTLRGSAYVGHTVSVHFPRVFEMKTRSPVP